MHYINRLQQAQPKVNVEQEIVDAISETIKTFSHTAVRTQLQKFGTIILELHACNVASPIITKSNLEQKLATYSKAIEIRIKQLDAMRTQLNQLLPQLIKRPFSGGVIARQLVQDRLELLMVLEELQRNSPDHVGALRSKCLAMPKLSSEVRQLYIDSIEYHNKYRFFLYQCEYLCSKLFSIDYERTIDSSDLRYFLKSQYLLKTVFGEKSKSFQDFAQAELKQLNRTSLLLLARAKELGL